MSTSHWLSEAAAWALDAEGEPVTYVNRAGDERSISAIVDREVPAKFAAMPRLTGVRLLITVENDAAAGISTAEVDRGDSVRVPARIGKTAVALSLDPDPVSQDAGMVTYALRH